MTDFEDIEEKGRRFRSPPYPAISLVKAIDRAAALFTKAQHHSAGINVIADAWRLSSQSGGLLKIAAALIQYGLLSDSGSGNSRKFQLTDIARRIIQDNDPSSEKRAKAIQTAALGPMVHREIWEKFGSAQLISDTIIKNHLILDRVDEGNAPYSESAALEVIQNYRGAVNFAKLENSNEPIASNGVDELLVQGANTADKFSSPNPQDVGAVAIFKPMPLSSPSARDLDIKVMLDGDILRVNAVVDARGIRKLIKVLQANLALIEDEI